MKLPSRPQAPVESPPGVSGTVRVDRRTSSLIRRLRPGDIAVIDHLDLDRSTAAALLNRDVRAVVNASPFISGRYPNLGPELLAKAGVVLLDQVGSDVFTVLKDGEHGRVDREVLYVGEQAAAHGRALDTAVVVGLMDDARSGLAAQLQSFAHNTTEFLRRDQGLLLHGQGVPELTTELAGRPVVVVAEGYNYREDLRLLKRFIRDQKPVLLGVDSGADALLEAGLEPELLIVGQNGFDTAGTTSRGKPVSDKAFHAAREVVVHSDGSGRIVGAEKIERLGVRAKEIAANGTAEDIALLLADIGGASLVVTVGTHATLDEFLDRQHAGLASTFLTRLRVGPKLVDAKSVPQLYAGRVRLWQLALVLLAGLLAVGAAVATTPVGQDWLDQLQGLLQ